MDFHQMSAISDGQDLSIATFAQIYDAYYQSKQIDLLK